MYEIYLSDFVATRFSPSTRHSPAPGQSGDPKSEELGVLVGTAG